MAAKQRRLSVDAKVLCGVTTPAALEAAGSKMLESLAGGRVKPENCEILLGYWPAAGGATLDGASAVQTSRQNGEGR